MSVATEELKILQGAREVFNNPRLRRKDIKEWKDVEIDPMDGEVVAKVKDLGVWVAILKPLDRR